MFRVHAQKHGSVFRYTVIGLLSLTIVALIAEISVIIDFARDQENIQQLIRNLPSDARESAKTLTNALRWQFRLTTLAVLSLVVTGVAVAMLWRAYRSSQDSLRDIKALAGDILGSMEQAVITTDLNGIVTSINRRGLELFSPSRESVGRSLKELSNAVPLDQFRKDWTASRSPALTRDFKTEIDGDRRVLRAFCQTLRDTDENEIGYVLQVLDVTERILIEDRMRRMERYMGLGSLAAGLHHEIKNPLAALSLHVQLLEEQLDDGEGSPESVQMLSVIKSEVSRIGDVLEGFRDFASTLKLNLAPVHIHDVIQRQVDLILPQARERSVEINLHIADDFPQIVHADRVRLEQVILNLLINALEAMPTGGKLTVRAYVEDTAAVIEVTDTGGGVPLGLRDKIFDPYFTTKSDGTGLGLALCDKIIRQHNGGLELNSTPQGATFRFTLPTRQATPPSNS